MANLLLNVKNANKGVCFEWESGLFENLISIPDRDLINILKKVYATDSEKYIQILDKEDDLLKDRQKQIDDEKSFVQS